MLNKYRIMVAIPGLWKPEQSESSSQSLQGPGKTQIIDSWVTSVCDALAFFFQVTNVDANLR